MSGAVAGGASTLSLSPQVRPGNWPRVTHRRGAYATAGTARRWVDYEAGLLSVLLGHAYPEVARAVQVAAAGLVTLEERVAETVRRLCGYPDGRVRFCATGTHACEGAIRVARAVTGRSAVLSIGYHGWSDATLTAAPGWGVPPQTRALTVAVPWGSLDAVEAVCFGLDPATGKEWTNWGGKDLACVILEPATLADPPEGYLEGIYALALRYGFLVIFDECITGGRYEKFTYGNTHLGAVAGVPDLTVVSKGLANGLPLAAIVGRADLMVCFEPGWRPPPRLGAGVIEAPFGPVYVSGTWSAPALSLAPAEATLRVWEQEGVAQKIRETGKSLAAGLRSIPAPLGLMTRVDVHGQPYRLALDVWAEDGSGTDYPALTYLRQQLVEHGVLTGSGFNLMLAHADEGVVQRTLNAWTCALDDLQGWYGRGSPADELAGGRVCVPPYRQS